MSYAEIDVLTTNSQGMLLNRYHLVYPGDELAFTRADGSTFMRVRLSAGEPPVPFPMPPRSGAANGWHQIPPRRWLDRLLHHG